MRLSANALAIAFGCLGWSLGALADPQGSYESAPAVQVVLLADGGFRELPTKARTVGELLDTLDIALDPLDRTHPSPRTPLADGMLVRVTRVDCREVVEEEPIPADTLVLGDPDKPAGFTQILLQGKDGLLRRVVRIWAKDGKETVRAPVEEEVIQEPTDTIFLRGTHGMPTRGGDWRRPLMMEATAYEPGPRSCGRWATGYTATGVRARRGVVAVDERVIPMGARLYIPGYGFAVAADRGAAIKGMRIDLCFPTYEEAIHFGRRRVKVYLLD